MYKNKSITLTVTFLLIAFIIIIVMYSDFAKIQDIRMSEKGVLDLTSWNHQTIGSIKLDGEWDFYWNKLLKYEDLLTEQPDIYANVPHFWNAYTIRGQKIDSYGYATYRLHVKTNIPPNTAMAFKINTFSSAYKLYVNERLIASNGTVAQNSKQEVGEHRPQVALFYTPSEKFDIIIQVSNFQYSRAGFWYSIQMGSANKILWQDYRDVVKETIIIGALVVSSIYYFALYYLKRELK